MRTVIIAAKQMRPELVTGLDIYATKEGVETDPDFIANNTGARKLYPCGSVCKFKGKPVPCIISNTENGSITSELLKSRWMN